MVWIAAVYVLYTANPPADSAYAPSGVFKVFASDTDCENSRQHMEDLTTLKWSCEQMPFQPVKIKVPK